MIELAAEAPPAHLSLLSPIELRARLEELAAAHERSLAGEVRVALRSHLERFDAETEEAT